MSQRNTSQNQNTSVVGSVFGPIIHVFEMLLAAVLMAGVIVAAWLTYTSVMGGENGLVLWVILFAGVYIATKVMKA